MLEEVIVRAQSLQLLKPWLCIVQWLDTDMENQAPFVEPCMPRLQVLQSSVHLIDLLNILVRRNDFTGIQKSVVLSDQQQTTNTNHNIFGVGLALGSALEFLLIPTTEQTIDSGHIIQSIFQHMPQPARTSLLLYRTRKKDSSK